MLFDVLADKAKKSLEKLASDVACISPDDVKTWDNCTSCLDESGETPKLIREIKDWAVGSVAFIYVVSAKEIDDETTIELARSFADAKAAEKGKRAYARLNEPSHHIYVGSSAKLHQRIKEHLGYGAKATYSLQLAAWAQPHKVDLTICCAKYPDNTDQNVLQALEDALWSDLQPMFGRQGAR